MNTTVAVAVLAAGISAVGWFVNHVLSERAERNRRKHVARLAYVERQLEELYGPLFFLMHEGDSSFRDFVKTLGRSYVFGPDGEVSQEELATWLFWVDHDLMPRNAAIQGLLSTKAHLIDTARMPDSYLAFIDHHNSWRVSYLRWKEEGVPYRWRARENWPNAFMGDIVRTYEELKRRQARLAGRGARA